MSKTTRSAAEGLGAGIVASVGLAVVKMLATDLSPLTIANIAGLAATFGLVYGIVNAWVREDTQQNPWAQAALGTLFGAALYAVHFQLIARAAYPWFLDVPQYPQLAMHALAFGLPLGLIYAGFEWRVHTVPRNRPVYASR